MAKKIAINGFGRIGRLTLRNLIVRDDVEIVGINDLTDTATLAHLFEYDSSHRRFNGTVAVDGDTLIVNGKKIPTFSKRNPEELPWKELEVDVVLECTGFFRKKEQAMLHIKAGAKKVLLSAPAKSDGIPTIVKGVNDALLKGEDLIVSNASCTTNCLAPLVKVIDENWGIQYGFMSTIHAYTANQKLQDAPHSDLRRARAAALNMIPTTTGAANALALVMPSVKGKISASSIRVPVSTGSLVELVCALDKSVDEATVNATFQAAAEGGLKGILEYSEKPLVSTDIISNPSSSIFDAPLTTIHNGMLKVTAWYDNEAGYSARLAELATMI
ncbi:MULTISPECIES: type I glyceraldehyde-3-phosphate dehydrogenase [unclassified Aureispira]|uniref:type I glyceraldehyde-3-phosphate dehydrogenase n=1 Tax=unclassified Aureispira TaxID=2649989 RepID=UPI000698D5D9|nr:MULTISPECIES: type I glyceraldehyde-3-phosphate dehydrogenase [unclassified Aureispira]WMX17272.1 type I glyceraldehyde-3-phosphate dehydrogenase [Aureispira sp. CCB-E]